MAHKHPPDRVNPADVPLIKKRLLEGEYWHKIAADHGLTHDQISEINAGKMFPEILPAP